MYKGYVPPAIENDRNAPLTIEYLCAAPGKGYGTSLIASIALFFADNIKLYATRSARPFYQTLGMTSEDGLGNFFIDRHDLDRIYERAFRYMTGCKS